MAKERSRERDSELRKRAERILAQNPQAIRSMATTDIQKLIHELNVHQIELEMQNAEFRRVQLELQEARDKYLDLYDFAPTGYFTLDRNSLIVDVNLVGSTLLGSEKPRLIGTKFTASIPPDFQDAFYFHYREVLKAGIKGNCELKMLKADGTPFHAQLISVPVPKKDGNINHCRTSVIDITERKKAELALQESEEKYRNLVELANDGIGVIQDTILKYANRRLLEMWGGATEGFIGTPFTDHVWPEEFPKVAERYRRRMAGEAVPAVYETALKRNDGGRVDIELNAGVIQYEGKAADLVFVHDITERKQSQMQQELALKVLERLNLHGGETDTINDILLLVREFSGCSAAGIRLKKGDDYPYYVSNGFIEGHLETENSLCSYDEMGGLIRDVAGNPFLECMCGNVIRGRFDSSKPFFTEGGSFWTNSTTDLLASTTEVDRLARTRNRCNAEGYESVALMPLKIDGGNIGLLQLNDFQRNRFSPQIIRFYERLAQSIGVVLERKQMEGTLKESEEKFSKAFLSSPTIMAIVSLKDDRYIEVNESFQRFTGYRREEIVGKTGADMGFWVQPEQVTGIKQLIQERGAAHDIEITFRTKSGEVRTLLVSSEAIDIGGEPCRISTGEDITERKRMQEALQGSLTKLQKAMDGTVNAIALTSEMRDPYTAGHQRRVSRLACAIAEEMALHDWQVQGIRMTGLLHDIGKIGVPAEILSRPGKLTEMEFNLVKTHALVGSDILKTIDFPWPIAEMVRQHHERIDGSGYPLGLKGKDISLEARILAVADVVEAMTSHRPFRPALGIDKALQEIGEKKGILYDPKVADACIKLFTDKKFSLE